MELRGSLSAARRRVLCAVTREGWEMCASTLQILAGLDRNIRDLLGLFFGLQVEQILINGGPGEGCGAR